jgi:hypothetical protein
MSGTSPGSAVCTIEKWDGTARTSGTETVTVKNDHGVAVGSNKLVTAFWWQGDYWVLTEAC